jgi:1,5-anhydro-D-fructose reductase (1,5-anhydro-D-mannitol-forming)
MAKLRWALAGSGWFADDACVGAIRAATNTELVGVLGSSRARGHEFNQKHKLPRVYDTIDALAADQDVDAVWITTPNHLHVEQALRLMKGGKHVLIEKPLATTYADAQAVAVVARQTGRVARVGYHHRFRRSHQEIRDRIRAGQIGNVCFIRIRHFVDLGGLPSTWRRASDTSGGWAINDVGTHIIDLMLWLTKLPADVAGAVLAAQRHGLATDDGAAVLFRLGVTGIGVMETSMALANPGSSLEVFGDAGWIRTNDSFGGGSLIETANDGRVQLASGRDPFVAEVEAMADEIAGKDTDLGDLPLAAENVRLIQEARLMDAETRKR